jgi:hypothetical protein
MRNTIVLLKSWGNISNIERINSYIHAKSVTISAGSRKLESIIEGTPKPPKGSLGALNW